MSEFGFNPELIYNTDKEKESILLTPEQKEAVVNITLGIEEVDESVREFAVDDVLKTLENGYPLNRLIENSDQETIGYVACEDFVPHEAYIKYFGTDGGTGRNLLREIPAFLEYAKEQGYSKINFHGWNKRLNRILERFGFKRLGTEAMGEFNVDLYEKSLTEERSPETISAERARAFEQKYLNKINKDYEQTLTKFSKENRETKERELSSVFNNISTKLQNAEDFDFNERAKAVLRLKLARHFQNNDSIDENVLFDAIVETPKFLQSDKGSFFRLFEIHQEKTIQKIAENRKNRAEISGDEESNPYEALFETDSDNYYMARLLNMPHLEQESDYMKHCVGTSTSYINQIKNGDIEILSFRKMPKIAEDGRKIEGDRPVITIKYNLRTKTIEQMKKANDNYLSKDDPYYNDVIDALKKLRHTKTDMDKTRNFTKIASSELENFQASPYHLLTENGEMNFKDYDPDSDTFVLKIGEMKITPSVPKEDAAKIIRIVENIKVNEDEIARTEEELNENSKIYIGPLFKEIFQKYPNLEHVYTSFPEGKINQGEFDTTGKNGSELKTELKEQKISMYDSSEFMLQSSEFVTSPAGEKISIVRLKVRDLFSDSQSHAFNEIIARADELGLDLLPHETGPDLLLNEETQPRLGEWHYIAMKPIAGRRGYPHVFRLNRDGVGLLLIDDWTEPDSQWNSDDEIIFRLRKDSQES